MENEIFTESEIGTVAARIVASLKPGDILALSGPLAAGKTTLTQAMMSHMGYLGRVTSPTFVIERRYKVNWHDIKEVIHLDFYRLDKKELAKLDWEEYTNHRTGLVIIEWPERAESLLPKTAHLFRIEKVNEKTKKIQY